MRFPSFASRPAMTKITRQPTRKTLPPNEHVTKWTAELLNQADEAHYMVKLKELISSWPIIEDKTDLFHWTDLLNRFDDQLETILALHIPTGKLQNSQLTSEERELVLGILEFSRILLETCSSRNIYNSYDVSSNLCVLYAVLLTISFLLSV